MACDGRIQDVHQLPRLNGTLLGPGGGEALRDVPLKLPFRDQNASGTPHDAQFPPGYQPPNGTHRTAEPLRNLGGKEKAV